jgi:hypothetical protein
MLTHYSRRRWQHVIFMGRSIRARKRHCIAINPRRKVKPHTRCYRTMRRSNRRGTSSAHSGTMFRRRTCGCTRTRIRVIVPGWNPSRRHIRSEIDAQVRPGTRKRVQGQGHPRCAWTVRRSYWTSCKRRTKLGRSGSRSVSCGYRRRDDHEGDARTGCDRYAKGKQILARLLC